jgi:hypothetical protein
VIHIGGCTADGRTDGQGGCTDEVPRDYIDDVDSSDDRANWSERESMCLTHSRAKSGGFYVTTHKRRQSTTEMGRFQGMSPRDVPWQTKWGMSRTSFNGALGNSMSVNVLQRLLPRVLEAAGLIESEDWKDHWAQEGYNPLR